MMRMRGVPWEPIPGRIGSQIPVDVDDHGETIEFEEREGIPFEEDEDSAKQEIAFKGGPDKLHVSRKATTKYGTIDGCPACGAIKRRGHQPGRLGYNHSQVCREKIIEAMRNDPEYQQLMQRHKQMATASSIPTGGEENMAALEVLTESQVNEKRHQIQKAVRHIKQQHNVGEEWIGITVGWSDVVHVSNKNGCSRSVQPTSCGRYGSENGIEPRMEPRPNDRRYKWADLGIQSPRNEKQSYPEITARQATTINRQPNVYCL